MAAKASPRSNSSSASSPSSSRKGYSNAQVVRERNGIAFDGSQGDGPNLRNFSRGSVAKVSLDSKQHNRGQWANSSQFGRGSSVQERRGVVAEVERGSFGNSITDRNRPSWRSNKQGVDHFSGGRSKPSYKEYEKNRDMQSASQGQSSFTPRETWNEYGGMSTSRNPTTRPQGLDHEDVHKSRFQSMVIGERREWERHPPNSLGLPVLQSVKNSTLMRTEVRNINSHQVNSRGWESPRPTDASVDRRSFKGYGSAVIQTSNRGDWGQKRQQDFGVRKGERDGSTSHVGRSFEQIMPLDSPSAASRSASNQTAATAGRTFHDGSARSASREKGPLVPASFSVLMDEGLDDATLPFIVGSCEDMCPVKEREQRERLRDLALFERLNGNPRKTSRELAVKKFCRTFSGVKLQPCDVRPLPILWSTLQYLLNLLDDNEFSFAVVYDFLFDRTRAIRQELGMQRIANSQGITMFEEIVRFHILSEHELSQRVPGRHASDSHLNLQQLSKSLTSLFDLYGLKTGETIENEAEFRAYYVLLNLGNVSRNQADSLSLWFRQCPAVLHTPEMRCYRTGNFKAFFSLTFGATFLQGCLMELHFNEVRLNALEAINQGGYKLHPIPLADIAKLLLMKEGDLEELCSMCSLSTGIDNSRVRCLLVKQSQFSAPKEVPCYRCPCIVNKRARSYYEEIKGVNRKT